jgi:hypothetical protein
MKTGNDFPNNPQYFEGPPHVEGKPISIPLIFFARLIHFPTLIMLYQNSRPLLSVGMPFAMIN